MFGKILSKNIFAQSSYFIYKCLNISEKMPTGHYYIEQCCLGNCRYICFNICAKHSSDNDKEASIVIVF